MRWRRRRATSGPALVPATSRGPRRLLQPECSAQPGAHLLRRDAAVAVLVQRVEDRVGPAPLLTGDEAVAVEIEDAEQIARGIGGVALHLRSEERRVGKECRSRW